MFLIIALITMGASWWISNTLKRKFEEYSQIPLASGLSGAEVAAYMLRDYGISDVKITQVPGQLTDHYNPANKTVNLSEGVYHGRNAAAVAVAAHECGHAVQHATAYSMIWVRSKLVPVQQISARVLNFLNIFLLFGGGLMYGGGLINSPLLLIIVLANLGVTLFAIVTLPVEFDASKKALAWVENKGIVTSNEHSMAKDALWWAAMTYVVAALGALAQLLYWASIFLGRRD